MDINKIELRIQDVDEESHARYREILCALLTCWGLDGVKSGKTIIHFNGEGNFMGISLDYMPWRKRKKMI